MRSSGHGPPVASCPSDWGIEGGASGNLTGSGIREVPTSSWLEVARVGEVGALSASAGFGTPFGLGGFKGSGVDFSA
jgi:hypothetical protein